MDKSELLAEFQSQLDKLDQFQSFIDKARNMSGKFNPAVVEKVITDNEAKIAEVVETVDPLIPEVRDLISAFETEKAEIASGVEDAKLALEELEPRKMIGEISDEDYDKASAEAQEKVGSADERIAAIDADLTDFRGVLDAWAEKAPNAAESAGGDEDLLGALEDEEEEDLLDEGFGEEGFGDEDEAFAGESGRGSNVHAERVDISDDVSAVFADDDEPIPAGDDDDLAVGEELVDLDGDGDGDAVLVMNEGTSEESVCEFEGEVISLGRNRDNTIQVKNDSKVSRYHCKVYKRDGYYFIEDNKSANGTLVDGQLITEKRLLGGEEIIVGETMFRFRISG